MCGCPAECESARSSSIVSKAPRPSPLAEGAHFCCQEAAWAVVAAGRPTAAAVAPPSAAPSKDLLDVFMTLITSQLFVHDQEGAQAVEVVGGPFTSDVVRVVADVGTDGDVGEVRAPVGADRELGEHALVAAVCDGLEMLVQISLLGAAREGVGEHAGAGRLGPVVAAGALVDHLEPAAGRRVLVLLQAGRQLAEDAEQLGPAGVALRNAVQHADDRHGVPADRTAPVLGGEPGARVGPAGALRLVV